MSDPEMEAEATAFAMELLMPAAFLSEDIRKMGSVDISDEKSIAKLAKKYRVDAHIMALRIGELK